MKQALSAAVAIKELAHDLIQENLGNIIVALAFLIPGVLLFAAIASSI